MPDRIEKTDAEWRESLTPEQYRVLRERGTERPFSATLAHTDGVYRCAACQTPLFAGADRFDSRSGWPSFSDVADRANVALHDDRTHGMVRIEVACAACGGHLGHVFDDGPAPTGLRYCINAAALDLDGKEHAEAASPEPGLAI